MMVVVMVAERGMAPSATAALLVLLGLAVSLSWSCSECEDGVDGKRELGATSVSWMPLDAACSAADLLNRYRLYSSPRTSGADDDGEDEDEDGQRGAALWEVATVAVVGTSAVRVSAFALASLLFDAAKRACATRRMYGHLLSRDAVEHAHLHDGAHWQMDGVDGAEELLTAWLQPPLFFRLLGR